MTSRNSSLRTPSYRLHRSSGQAIVTLGGKDIYLGRHGTPQSRAEYDRFIAECTSSTYAMCLADPSRAGE